MALVRSNYHEILESLSSLEALLRRGGLGEHALNRLQSRRKWEVVPFTDPPPPLPDESGIYMFVAGPYCGGLADHSYIFYVGKATSLKKRYPKYLTEKAGAGANPRERVVIFLNHFHGYLQFHYTLVPKEELTMAEALLKDNLTPYGNTQLELKGRLAK